MFISLALIANNTADIGAANEQISATQSDLVALTSRVDKLEGMNKYGEQTSTLSTLHLQNFGGS
jgi:hypothetical protein